VADAPNLPENHTDGDGSHTAGHNDTNRSVNLLKTSYDAHANASIGSAHGGGVALSVFDGKGEILVGTGDNTYDTLPAAADGKIVTWDSSTTTGLAGIDLSAALADLGVGTGTQTVVQDEGVALPARGAINFVGTAVTVTDDSGNDRVVVTIATNTNTVNYKKVGGAGQTVTNSTTLVDATNLSQTVNTGEVWECDGVLGFLGDPAADAKVTMLAPTGSTQFGALRGLAPAATGSTGGTESGTLSGVSPSSRQVGTLAATGTPVTVIIKGTLTAGAAGSWRVQWAQLVGSATASTLTADSWLTFSRIS
jgi:hypothetical protein